MADVSSYLAQHSDEAQTLLAQLCSQPSVAAQGLGMPEMANLMESLLQENGFTTQRLYAEGAPPAIYGELKGAPPAIYGELKGSGPFTLLLYNHYDVQPAEPLDLWESPAFEPTIRDGKFYARGSADNKGEIASRLAAIRALRTTIGTLPITLRWIIEGEEEVGSPHFDAIASKYSELLQADGCLWEGSGFDTTNRPVLCLGTKGLLYVQLDVQGTGIDTHSGMAPILPSAAWRLVQALATLRDAEGNITIPGFYDDALKPTQAQLNMLVNQADNEGQMLTTYGIEQFADGLTGLALKERATFAPTCNIAGLVSGYTGEGVKTVLPAHATAKIDFRLVPNQDPQDILFKLHSCLKLDGYEDIAITVFSSAEPVATPFETPFVQQILAIAEAFAGKPASITPLTGGTLPLLGALRKHVGVPGLSAPGNVSYWGSGAHAPNEHIRLSDLERGVRFNCAMFQMLGE